jgi:hypothetical protein
MKKRNRIILFILSHAVALGIGVVGVLWYMTVDLRKFNSSLTGVAIISRYEMMAVAERGLGKEQEYRDALLDLLTGLEEARKLGGPLFTEKSYHKDRALTITRLALIEEKMGAEGKAKEYFKKAFQECQSTGWSDCSITKLRSVIEVQDRKNDFNLRQ